MAKKLSPRARLMGQYLKLWGLTGRPASEIRRIFTDASKIVTDVLAGRLTKAAARALIVARREAGLGFKRGKEVGKTFPRGARLRQARRKGPGKSPTVAPRTPPTPPGPVGPISPPFEPTPPPIPPGPIRPISIQAANHNLWEVELRLRQFGRLRRYR